MWRMIKRQTKWDDRSHDKYYQRHILNCLPDESEEAFRRFWWDDVWSKNIQTEFNIIRWPAQTWIHRKLSIFKSIRLKYNIEYWGNLRELLTGQEASAAEPTNHRWSTGASKISKWDGQQNAIENKMGLSMLNKNGCRERCRNLMEI